MASPFSWPVLVPYALRAPAPVNLGVSLTSLKKRKVMARKSSEKYPGQRNKEKRELFSQYPFRIIDRLYKQKFFHLFDNRCFKCGKLEKSAQEIGFPPNLCMDHHIPMALGGHLIPGNLVSLCRRCNGLKLDRSPVEFYTQEELKRLQPLLESQEELFKFSFNIEKWKNNKEAYLLELGIEKEIVHAALHDEYSVNYIGDIDIEGKKMEISITIDQESIERSLNMIPKK